MRRPRRRSALLSLRSSTDFVVALGAALIAFVVYVVTACPTVHWLDAGELTAAAFHLVPAHAPGEPAYVLFGRLATLIPAGSIAFRANALSSLSGALATGVLALMGLAWLNHTEPDTPGWYRRSLGLIALAGAVFGYPIWIQSVRAEVYALHLALAATGIATSWMAARGPKGLDMRWTALSALTWGVDLAVHPLLAGLAFLPAAVVAVARTRRWQPRVWLVALVSGVVGWSSHAMLPLRAIRHPGFGWGDAGTVDGFLDMVLARSFQHNFSPMTSDLLGHNLGVLGRIALDHVGTAGVLLAVLGFVWLALVKKQGQAILAALVVGFATLSVVTQNKVYADNPDLLGYMALPIAAIWGLAAAGTASIVAACRAWVPRGVAPAALVVSVLPAVFPAMGPADRSEDYQARMLGLAAFHDLDPGALLVVSGNDTTFVTQYLQDVERMRPDVLVLPRALVTHPWFRARLPYPDPVLRAAVASAGTLARAVNRPVRVELREQDLPDSRHLCPVPAPGWGFYDVRPCHRGIPPPRPLPGLFQPDKPETSRHALLLGLNAALFLCDYYDASGHSDWARSLRQRLRARAPSLTIPAP